MKKLLIGILLIATINGKAQIKSDSSTHVVYAPSITVVGNHSKKDIHFLPEIVGTNINAGKKNALLVIDNIQGNTVNNTMRQIVAKIPGIHIWESDGSGIQIGIAARGLSPNRSWEFNVRQNGYDISADPYGYPEAYYNPQLQAVQRLEVLRGQAALQYGPQFGGLVNYILKDGSQIKKTVQIETQNSAGSNQLFNNYTAVGGTYKKLNYYAFADHRNSSGWRQNSKYFTNNYSTSLTYQFNEKIKMNALYTNSHIRSQQPGGLTESQFTNNPQQSSRSRNWMDIVWHTAALNLDYKISENSQLNVKAFAVLGDRNSIGFLQNILINDTINKTTNQYNNRDINVDKYRNYAMEARWLQRFKLAGSSHSLSAGIRAYTGTTYRYRSNKGNNSTEYNVTPTDNIWTTNLSFASSNYAAFAENVFRISKNLTLIPGLRVEHIGAKVSGQNGVAAGIPIILLPQQKQRSFVLLGLNAEYHPTANTEFYGGAAQAYRPIQFADLITPPTTDEVDPNIKDANGYNADLGYRGVLRKSISFDFSVFYLYYNNRIGTLTQQRLDGSFYNYRTNVGASVSKGIESLIDVDVLPLFEVKTNHVLKVFNSYSYTNASYNNLAVVTKNNSNQLVSSNLKNNKVENAPEHILRSGITYGYKSVSVTTQLSYTSSSFADANNTVQPTANAQNGLIPSYTIIDVFANINLPKQVQLKLSVNNAANKAYFTRRAGGYPGPGLMPADGRTVTATISFKL